MSRELVRVDRDSDNCPVLWLGETLVRRWPRGTIIERAEFLAAAIRKELEKEFQQRAGAVAKESRYREVRHY
jgi:hypothetical protein